MNNRAAKSSLDKSIIVFTVQEQDERAYIQPKNTTDATDVANIESSKYGHCNVKCLTSRFVSLIA